MTRPGPVELHLLSASHPMSIGGETKGAKTPWKRMCRSLGGLAIVGALALGFTPHAFAQDASLGRQVEQLRKDLNLLQRYVYRENPPSDSGSAASTGAGADAGSVNTPAAARQQVQIDAMQGQIAQLTGQIEEMGHRIRKAEDRLDRLVSDVDYRLSQLENKAGMGMGANGNGNGNNSGNANGQNGAGMSGAAAGGMAGSSNDDGGSAMQAAPATDANGQPIDNRGSKLFGVLKGQGEKPNVPEGPTDYKRSADNGAGANDTAAAGGSAAGSVLPDGDTQEQYRYAFDLLRRKQFDDAETALRAFIKAHPKDPLAGNAQYWLGETFYVRGDYDKAAIEFTDGFQKYPKSPKAADNLLKLGMSLANLGKTEDACTTYAHLLSNYQDSSQVVLDRARQEQKNRGCK